MPSVSQRDCFDVSSAHFSSILIKYKWNAAPAQNNTSDWRLWSQLLIKCFRTYKSTSWENCNWDSTYSSHLLDTKDFVCLFFPFYFVFSFDWAPFNEVKVNFTARRSWWMRREPSLRLTFREFIVFKERAQLPPTPTDKRKAILEEDVSPLLHARRSSCPNTKWPR